MNKQNMVLPIYNYAEILFSNKNVWNTDTYHNMNEPWKHYSESKKPEIKGHMFDSIYKKCPEMVNH